MSFLTKIAHLVKDPPPEYAFEVSEAGIAWMNTTTDSAPQWKPFSAGTIRVSPLKDNILAADSYRAMVESFASTNGNRKSRRAALILPDYCSRLGVLDFDTFPGEHEEQLALVRFRVKRGLALDVESANLSWFAQPKAPHSSRVEVVVAVISPEIAARYEAPFRAAGFHTGFVTVSALAALALGPSSQGNTGVVMKRSGRVLALSVLQGHSLKMIRCVELSHGSEDEVWDVLLPTIAYMEDQLASRPESIKICGFEASSDVAERWSQDLGAPVVRAVSKFGEPGPYNAGLLGYLETLE